ncbi:TlpA family protein disulfide reductase [Burkholderia sp. BKH01]|uniref:TlpA family protein disulfide reductase n=1 Tax=Burkholderia sp. BKH01 TaxID=2769262 RepID=UPI0021E058EF|nr:TlpA disulfide reductase family protein [Burkholderia sp. BKH01]MCU9952925.1 TlpA family protein disulfide reductase [Burkholderia sp. BKH01]
MLSIGPFSVRVVAVAIAALIAWLVARFAQRNRPAGQHKTSASLLLDALLIGLIAARVGYIARWWSDYFAAPKSIVALGDGGFTWWIGLPVALAYIGWRSRRLPGLARPALAGIAAGMLAWGAAQGVLATFDRTAAPLSALRVETLDATPVAPNSYAGKPVVVNLWATWCPPCQREMPILAQAQQDYPGVSFLMINQGEDVQTVRAFLEREGLRFDHVLLDRSLGAMRTYGSRGLPTTLFFDERGKLVESHMGEITAARLKDTVNTRFSR